MKKLAVLAARALAVVPLAVAFPGCGSGGTAGGGKTTPPSYHAPAVETGLIFKSPELQFQVLRAMGATAYGAADVGECLETAARVDESRLEAGDFDSWYDAWYSTAERLRPIADGCLARGDRQSARDTYLRCNTYYNMSEFYLHGDPSDPRIADASGKARDCFVRAGKLLDPPVQEVRIKYRDTELPGYFYRVDESGKKRPLLIMQTGFDGTQEELYQGGAAAALERGYNVLTFEGPGQGRVLRERKLHFVKDWGNVVAPVIDYAVSRRDVDPGNISLWGVSMGGCLAARAAAREHRIRALILDPAMDMESLVLSSFGPAFRELGEDPDAKVTKESVAEIIKRSPDEVDEMFGEIMRGNVSATWFVQNGMFAFGLSRPGEFPLALLDYSLEGLSEKITARTLVCDSEQDAAKYGGMTRDIFDSLTCQKEYVMFTNAQGAGAHCQMGAARFGGQVKLDWLDAATGGS